MLGWYNAKFVQPGSIQPLRHVMLGVFCVAYSLEYYVHNYVHAHAHAEEAPPKTDKVDAPAPKAAAKNVGMSPASAAAATPKPSNPVLAELASIKEELRELRAAVEISPGGSRVVVNIPPPPSASS